MITLTNAIGQKLEIDPNEIAGIFPAINMAASINTLVVLKQGDRHGVRESIAAIDKLKEAAK